VFQGAADHDDLGLRGGTGASPRPRSGCGPWESGLAETHQTRWQNRPRGRIAVQVDGGIRTAATSSWARSLSRRVRLSDRAADRGGLHHDAQVPSQHLPGRRRHARPGSCVRFVGKPEHVVNFFVAEEVREWICGPGLSHLAEMVGQMQMLDKRQ
jgi:glutamate synthase (NADPH/NADH) large chain